MKLSVLTATIAMGLSSTMALAQSTNSADSPFSYVKLSQSECTNLWTQAKGSSTGLTATQAAPFVSDFKAANPDGDTTIDQNEWMAACNKGLVKSASSSGASTGTSGSSSTGNSSSSTTGNSGSSATGNSGSTAPAPSRAPAR